MCHRVTDGGLEPNAIEFSRQARRVTTGNEAAETKRNGYRTRVRFFIMKLILT